jgi:hypothetical protein
VKKIALLVFAHIAFTGIVLFAQSVDEDRRLAEAGNAAAQFNMGVRYYKGEGVSGDLAEAVNWFTKAADQGGTTAMYNLGVIYRNGQGIERDYTKSFNWFNKAADKGSAAAQVLLGQAYENGWGVTKNREEAVFWYRKSADQGNPVGQGQLAFCYLQGNGVAKDEAAAVALYKKAAAQGNATACFRLGSFYYFGIGVEEDWVKAMYWSNKALEKKEDLSALDSDWIETQLQIIGGVFTIKGMQFANTDDNGTLINAYGASMRGSDVQYLAIRIVCDNPIKESISQSYHVKIIGPDGKVLSGSDSPPGYTITADIHVGGNKRDEAVYLTGWGNDSEGTYDGGVYTCEIWGDYGIGMEKIFSGAVTLRGRNLPEER